MRSFAALLVAWSIVTAVGYLALHSESELIAMRDNAFRAVGFDLPYYTVTDETLPPDCWFDETSEPANEKQ